MPASRRRGARPRPEPGGPKEAIVSARSSPHSGERRTTMRHSVVGVVFAATVLMGTSAQAQTWAVPTEAQRCPSKWGAGDERGSGNHMKPASVLRATQLIKTGEVIELGHPLASDMPLQSTRQFNV